MSTRRIKRGPRSPVQARSKRKKQAIVAAADRLFNRLSYSEITIPAIAKAAGVSVGTVYSYYKDKREVLLQVMQRANQGIVDTVESRTVKKSDLNRAVTTKILDLVEYFEGNKRRSLNFSRLSTIDDDFRKIRIDFDRKGVGILESLLLLGGHKKGKETKLLAFALYRMIHGSAQFNVLLEYRFKKAELVKLLTTLFVRCTNE